MTQSRAPTSHVWNRLDPAHSGVHRTLLFSWIIFCLNLVTLMNHWSVARSMSGVLQRQQCGYECSIVSSLKSNRLVSRSLTITGFASLLAVAGRRRLLLGPDLSSPQGFCTVFP